MRWPLRNQIMLPMTLLMIISVVSMSIFNSYLSLRTTRSQLERRLRDISKTLSESSFPLTNPVLAQMAGFSGAEFVLTDETGNIVSASSDKPSVHDFVKAQVENKPKIALDSTVQLADVRYYHGVIAIERRHKRESLRLLHSFYPQERFRQAFQSAVLPPLFVGGVTLFLMIAASLAISHRVARPLRQLEQQVHHIACGSFQTLQPPQVEDEISDLSQSINLMATKLADYEAWVRRQEQLRTLDQVSGGIAHQLRNSATGCKLAIELHERECKNTNDEGIQTAKRQLKLMEEYLQRLMTFGGEANHQFAQHDLRESLEDVLALVKPNATHLRVKLDRTVEERSFMISFDKDSIDQLLTNLILNAIEAASKSDDGRVSIEMFFDDHSNEVTIIVVDTGNGPSAVIADKLFQPLVSDKPEGAGLGLAVVHDVVTAHNGRVEWCRNGGETRFTVRLPATTEHKS